MATLAASSHVGEPLKELAPDNVDRAVKSDDADLIGRSERLERPERSLDRHGPLSSRPREPGQCRHRSRVLGWPGPVEGGGWEAPRKPQPERENFLQAPRIKPSALHRLQRMV